MGVEPLLIVLVGFLLLGVLIALETRDLLSSVIAIGTAGFALSIINLLVGAPDLAITQVVVEIISLVLLVRLVVARKDTSALRSSDALRTGLALLACGIMLAAALAAFGAFSSKGTVPRFGRPVLANQPGQPVPPGVGRDYLARSAGEVGAANSVMAVVLDYRGYDTLGEATVIFVAVLGAYVVLRRIGRRPTVPAGLSSEDASP